MPMTFPCRACGKKVSTSRKAQGKWGRCPHCSVEAIVPTLADSRIENTAESGERDPGPLTNTMADTVSAPAPLPAAPPPVPPMAPSFAAVALDLERDQLAAERLRVDVERARLDLERAKLEQRARDEDECEACAEPIKARARVCKHCGHVVGERVGNRGRSSSRFLAVPPAPRTSPNAAPAALLTLLIGPAVGWTLAGGCGWGFAGLGAQFCASAIAVAVGGRNEALILFVLLVLHVGLAFLAVKIANDQPDAVSRMPFGFRRRR